MAQPTPEIVNPSPASSQLTLEMVNSTPTPSQPSSKMVNPSQSSPELAILSLNLLMLRNLPYLSLISSDIFGPSPAPLKTQLLSPDPQQSYEKNWRNDGYKELLVIFKNEHLK